jgi:hypothetical protein
MVNVNDLLPFGTGVGANVTPQASWTGEPARLTGFQAGTASSAKANKALRQSSFVAAMIGQFTMHNALQDVLDDGNVDTFEAKFRTALLATSVLKRAATAGTAANATVTFVPPYASYTGIYFLLDITTALAAGATLNVDGLGVRLLERDDGSPIQYGDAPAGACMLVAYDGTNLRVLNMTATAIQSGTANYAPQVRVGGTANAITMTMIPTVLQYQEGTVYRFVPKFTNTGITTAAVDGLPAKPVTEMNGSGLIGSEFIAGVPAWIQDAGTTFVILRFASVFDPWSRPLPGAFYAYADPAPGYTNVAAGIWTKIAVTQEQFDAEGWYDPSLSRYTPQHPGFYYFTGDCSFGSNATLPTTGIRAFMNGSPTFATQIGDVPGSQFSTSANGSRPVLSGVTYCNGTTDYVELFGYEDIVDSNGFRRAFKARWGGWFIGR